MSLLGLLLWLVMVAGGLPRAGHHWIEGRLPFWDARWASIVSAGLEVLLGIGFFRAGLLQLGLEDAPSSSALVKIALYAFLALEGFVRLGGAITSATSIASLPVLLVWRVVAAVAGLTRRARGKQRPT